jgi:hypothetical protein
MILNAEAVNETISPIDPPDTPAAITQANGVLRDTFARQDAEPAESRHLKHNRRGKVHLAPRALRRLYLSMLGTLLAGPC